MIPPVWQLALYVSPTFFTFPPPSLPYPLSLPWDVPPSRMWLQPFSLILYRICTRARRNCGKPCADTVDHLTESVPSLTVSEKWSPAQRFDVQVADRWSPIQVLTQRKSAWLGWSPGTGHLPHTEHCRLGKKYFRFFSCFSKRIYSYKFQTLINDICAVLIDDLLPLFW